MQDKKIQMNSVVNKRHMKEQSIAYEEAIEELEVIAKKLEHGSVKLSEAVELYERGVFLEKAIEEQFKQATTRIACVNEPSETIEFLNSLDQHTSQLRQNLIDNIVNKKFEVNCIDKFAYDIKEQFTQLVEKIDK